MKPNTTPRIWQAISGVSLLAISLTVGLTSMRMNVNAGLQVGTESAIIFGAADAARLILPLVCGIIGWSRQLKAIAVLCVVASLFCAVTAFHSGSDQHLASKQAGAGQFEMAKADVAKADARVASLDASVAQETRNKGCGTVCKGLKEEAKQARAELSTAKAKLETAKPVAISGTETLESWIKSILLLIIVEALVWLSLPAVLCFKLAFAAHKTTKRKGRKSGKPSGTKKAKPVAKTNVVAFPPRLTKSGKIDGRSRQARAVKRIVGKAAMA